MSTYSHARFFSIKNSLGLGVVGLMLFSAWLIFFVAPTEATMGDVQRIVYLHVAVAWGGLAGAGVMGCCAVAFLVQKKLEWDHWSQAAGEVGWLCATLTLVTGSAWAHEAWGTWWTWEPRLTASLILWFIFAGIFLLRSGIEEPLRRARIGGVLALVGMSDIPLVMMATRWFRGVHPVAPQMEPRMRWVLLATVICYTALFAYLTVQRRRQLEGLELASQLEARAWSAYPAPHH
jgi:heme exporter protein C